MAIANPILATWDTDGTVRSYEFTGGTFVQLNSRGGYPYTSALGPQEAGIHWNLAGNVIVLGRPSSQNIQNAHTLNPILTPIGNTNSAFAGNSGGGVYSYDKFHDLLWAFSDPSGTGDINAFQINRTTGAFEGLSGPTTYGSGGFRGVTFSHDGQFAIFCDRISGGGAGLLRRIGFYSGGRFPIFGTPGSYPTITINVELAAFCPVGYTFIIVDKINARAQVGNIDPAANSGTGAMTLTHELVLPPGTPHRLAMCPDGRRAAISGNNANVFTTYVYERRGIYWVKVQTIANFGKLLEFSVDGYLLLDCSSRIAYRSDGQQYVSLPGALSNLSTLVAAAALDLGRGDKDATQNTYDEGLKSLVNGGINLSSLKFTILSSAASFDPTHTTLSQVTNSGAYEITAGGWPAGGELLTGVTRTGIYYLSANPIQRIMTAGFSTRYGVIYDTANGNRPILWIDFLEDKAVPIDTRLTFTFRDGKLVNYDR